MVAAADLPSAAIVRDDGGRALIWRDGMLIAPSPPATLTSLLAAAPAEAEAWFEGAQGERLDPATITVTAPVDSQQVWGAGVTYRRSRDARAEESGRDAMYDQVYRSARPEIFYKAAGDAVVGWGGAVGIRSDSTWNVPEPELAVLADASGRVFAYAIGNDMTSRSIEAENPLYLPQAKTYDRSCAIGPTAVPAWRTEPGVIAMTVEREGVAVFSGSVSPSSMVREIGDLLGAVVSWHTASTGLWLLTGTGIVPPDDFSLRPGDEVVVSIEGLGVLRNRVSPVGPR